MSPDRAVASGLALLPGDRQRDGGVRDAPVGENVMLQVLSRLHQQPSACSGGRWSARRGELLQRVRRASARAEALYESLSGGNQQKALLAKWLQTSPRCSCCTSRRRASTSAPAQQIFGMLRAAASAGAPSSARVRLRAARRDLRPRDRGRARAGSRELTGDGITKERIAEQVYNSVTLRDRRSVV